MSTMVNNFLCLAFALAIRRSASQILTVTPSCIPDKAEVILRCQTDNFNNAILFFLGVTNNGGCDGGSCHSGTAGYIPNQPGSLYTYMTITEYNDSRDGGVWTCNDGGASSNGYSLQLGNCEVTTEVISTEGTTSTLPTSLTTTPTSSTLIPTTASPTTTTPSTSPNTCRIFFKEKPCALNYLVLILTILVCIAALFAIGYLIYLIINGKINLCQEDKYGKEKIGTITKVRNCDKSDL